jgi:hypothetical protein
MGIHRINTELIEEYSSPADRRIRIETDIRMPKDGTAFEDLRGFLDKGNDAGIRLLLHRLLDDVRTRRKGRGKGRPDSDDIRRVRKLVDAAFGPVPSRKRKGRGKGKR